MTIRAVLVASAAGHAAAGNCCWSKWGDSSSCGNYPDGGSGAICGNDGVTVCTNSADCDNPQPSPTPTPTPTPTPSPTPTPTPGALNIDGLSSWTGSGEGPCIPQGNLLVQDGSGITVAKVAFKNEPDWFVAPIWLGNAWGVAEDLSSTLTFTIKYDAEADFWMQMRSKSHWSGGSQWATRLNAGQNMSKTISWADASAWETPLGTPAQALHEVLGETQGMIMVGNKNNAVTVYSLKIPGFTPPGANFIV